MKELLLGFLMSTTAYGLELQWDAPQVSELVTSHTIYSKHGDFPERSFVVPMPATSFEIKETEFIAGAEYCFQVAAVNGIGESPRTQPICSTVIYSAPNMPQNVRIVIKQGSPE